MKNLLGRRGIFSGRALGWVASLSAGCATFAIYQLQPLLPMIEADLAPGRPSIEWTTTMLLVGYTIGVALLVPLGDTRWNRVVLLALPVVTSVALAVMALTDRRVVFLGLALLLGMCSALPQLLTPLIARLTDAEHRGRAIGRIVASTMLGIVVGRSAGGIAGSWLGWRPVLTVTAGAVVAVALLLRHVLPIDPGGDRRIGYGSLVLEVPRILMRERQLRRRALFGTTAFASLSTTWAVLPLHLAELTGSHAAGVAGLLGLTAVAGVCASFASGRLLDLRGAQATQLLALGAMAVAWIPLTLSVDSILLLVIGLVVLEAGVAVANMSNQSYIYSEKRVGYARSNAAYICCVFTGGAVGAAGSVVVFESVGWLGTCVLGLSLAATCPLLLLSGKFRSVRVGRRSRSGVRELD